MGRQLSRVITSYLPSPGYIGSVAKSVHCSCCKKVVGVFLGHSNSVRTVREGKCWCSGIWELCFIFALCFAPNGSKYCSRQEAWADQVNILLWSLSFIQIIAPKVLLNTNVCLIQLWCTGGGEEEGRTKIILLKEGMIPGTKYRTKHFIFVE